MPDGHRIRWFVYAGDERIPRTSKMRGTWGYDAVCSCGWDSRTGGATKSSVDRAVWMHKFDARLTPDGQHVTDESHIVRGEE